MLIRREIVKDKALGYVQQILRAAERSADLAGQLLAFSRQQELRPTVANLDNVIAGLSKSLARMVGEDVRLSVVPCADLGNVKNRCWPVPAGPGGTWRSTRGTPCPKADN